MTEKIAKELFNDILDGGEPYGVVVTSDECLKFFRKKDLYLAIKDGLLLFTNEEKITNFLKKEYQMWVLLSDLPVKTGFCLCVESPTGSRVLIQLKKERVGQMIKEAIKRNGLKEFFRVKRTSLDVLH